MQEIVSVAKQTAYGTHSQNTKIKKIIIIKQNKPQKSS